MGHTLQRTQDRAIGLAYGKQQHKDIGNEPGNYFMKKGEQEGWEGRETCGGKHFQLRKVPVILHFISFSQLYHVLGQKYIFLCVWKVPCMLLYAMESSI